MGTAALDQCKDPEFIVRTTRLAYAVRALPGRIVAETSREHEVPKFLPPLRMPLDDWSEVGGLIGDVVLDVAALASV